MSTRDQFPIAARRGWLARFDRLIAADVDTLIELLADELAKPAEEAIASELLPLRAAIAWHRRRLASLLAPQGIHGGPWWLPGQRHAVVRVPLGRVGIIATWNYPLQILGIQLIQAIAAGNAVVVKPSEHAPRCQHRLLELAVAAGLPPGRLEVLPATREAGADMVASERLDHLLFTGSTTVGREIAMAAGARLLPTTLELSGRDSAIVLADADPRLTARVLWQAVAINGGQTCMAPRRILVERPAMRGLLDSLAPLVASARPRRLVSAAAASHASDLAEQALADGGRTPSGIFEPAEGAWMRPVAITHADPETPLVAGDHFGPAVAVVEVKSFEEALEIHGGIDQHLATSVFTAEPRRLAGLLPRLQAATVTVNDCLLPTAHPAVSIAGRRRSGWGTSRGEAGLLALTRTVTLSNTARRWRVPPETPSPTVIRGLRWLASRGAAGATAPARPARDSVTTASNSTSVQDGPTDLQEATCTDEG